MCSTSEIAPVFDAKRYPRDETRCAPWLDGVSSTGHGLFRAASLPGPSRRGTVPAHLFAYQLEYGIIPRLGWSGADLAPHAPQECEISFDEIMIVVAPQPFTMPSDIVTVVGE